MACLNSCTIYKHMIAALAIKTMTVTMEWMLYPIVRVVTMDTWVSIVPAMERSPSITLMINTVSLEQEIHTTNWRRLTSRSKTTRVATLELPLCNRWWNFHNHVLRSTRTCVKTVPCLNNVVVPVEQPGLRPRKSGPAVSTWALTNHGWQSWNTSLEDCSFWLRSSCLPVSSLPTVDDDVPWWWENIVSRKRTKADDREVMPAESLRNREAAPSDQGPEGRRRLQMALWLERLTYLHMYASYGPIQCHEVFFANRLACCWPTTYYSTYLPYVDKYGNLEIKSSLHAELVCPSCPHRTESTIPTDFHTYCTSTNSRTQTIFTQPTPKLCI